MAVKVSVVDGSGVRHAARVAENSNYVTIDRCPNCRAEPCDVQGTGITHHDHDTHYAAAVALCCRQRIGTLEACVDTIFGIDEDERVLNGRPRVY